MYIQAHASAPTPAAGATTTSSSTSSSASSSSFAASTQPQQQQQQAAKTVLSTLKQTLEEEGPLGLFKGMHNKWIVSDHKPNFSLSISYVGGRHRLSICL